MVYCTKAGHVKIQFMIKGQIDYKVKRQNHHYLIISPLLHVHVYWL